MSVYVCGDERRRDAVRAQHRLNGVEFNGIDHLEVVDGRTLLVYFIHSLKSGTLGKKNVCITGGERAIAVVRAVLSLEEFTNRSKILKVTVDQAGDYSSYTLRLSADPTQLMLDPLLSAIDFTFHLPADMIDCQREAPRLPEAQPAPEIDYLARDFNSFRQLMLDRLTTLMPHWPERSAADMGIMLVEVLAYVADHLSYQQDVIATESYLGTARRRVSARRHARLLDYSINDGCNARAWVQIQVNQDITSGSTGSPVLPKGTPLLTQVLGLDKLVIDPNSSLYNQALSSQPTIFETMTDTRGVFAAHNQISFYTWGARECCLPAGSTSATLYGTLPNLQPGDVLIFQELVDPHTGREEDAEPTHRHAVRLTRVSPSSDPLGTWPNNQSSTTEHTEDSTGHADKPENDLDDIRNAPTAKLAKIQSRTQNDGVDEEEMKKRGSEPDYSVPITEIEWDAADALPFPLCVSATTDYEHGHSYREDVSVALGNIILADSGMTSEMKDDTLIPNSVPESTLTWASPLNGQPCTQTQPEQVPPRFYPQLKYTPLTFAVPYDASDTTLSASEIMQFNPRDAVPAISLQCKTLVQDGSKISGTLLTWQPRRDLLSSNMTDTHFVVEVETDGSIYLRFGDDQHGLRPDAYTRFSTTYRVGNGIAGNIGRDALAHLVSSNVQLQGAVHALNNPLSALGGVDPESIEDIRQNAAGDFTLQERGITPQDYIDIAKRNPQVYRANAILRWTGSWYTIFLAVERVDRMPVDNAFKRQLRQHLEQNRMTGTDLVIVSPISVPLEISMRVTVKPGYLPNNIKTALLKVFSNRQWPDGERGVFFSDNYTFGQPVYLNPLYVAASTVRGVDTVTITTFQRQGIAGTGLADGVLTMDWLEIPILENNSSDPEHGLFNLLVEVQDMEVRYARG